MASVAKREWIYQGQKRTAYVVRYKEGGKHRSRQFERQKEAQAYRQKVEREINDGVHTAPRDDMRLATMCDLYMRWCEDRMRRGALGRPRFKILSGIIQAIIAGPLGNRKIGEIKPVEIEAWFKHLTQNGCSPNTARDRLGDLHSVFKYAIDRDMLKVNPMPRAFGLIGPISRTKVATFTVQQVRHLLEVAEGRQKYGHAPAHLTLRCMVNLAAFCGLRLSEILALRGEHVRFDRAVVEVRHSLDCFGTLKGPKTKSGVRDVPMPAHLMLMLQQKAAMLGDPSGFLFVTEHGRTMNQQSFRQHYWLKLLKRAGLYAEDSRVQFHFHALRHFAASAMLASDLSPPDVAEMLGHSHFDLTLRVYAHAIADKPHRARSMATMVDRVLCLPPVIDAQAL